jgi:hypothetical protein
METAPLSETMLFKETNSMSKVQETKDQIKSFIYFITASFVLI